MTVAQETMTTDQPGPDPAVLAVDGGCVCADLRARLADVGEELQKVCRDSDPHFVQTGRDLQAVAGETRALTGAIGIAAGLIGGREAQQSALGRSGDLIQRVLDRLTRDRQEIGGDLQQIRNLVAQISDCRRINDAIDRISASFRAVRINIRIQCSAQLISDDIFKDVTEDIDTLSKTLTQITKQIKIDLSAAAKNLTTLERAVSQNLLLAERMSANAKGVVTRAYGDIRHLLQGTETMIREASKRSTVIAEKIDEVVIAIQFHDSLSQRTGHILHAFADISTFCTPGEQGVDPEALGSAYLILDLQHRQLTHIVEEITAIHTRIWESFAFIGAEVKGLNSILVDSQFQAVGPEQFLRSLFSSLRGALLQLCELVGHGDEMIAQINATAGETQSVAARLVEIMRDVSEMRDETRLQAVNTIIMASNLGQRGRTIQVLAKEISALSEQTSELVSDVEVMQLAVSQKVEKLCQHWDGDGDKVSRGDLESEISVIETSYQEVEAGVVALSEQINASCGHVESVHAGLLFIQRLREGLRTVAAHVEQARDLLLPWRDQAAANSNEMQQLIERYTMEQERLIHLFDRGEERQARQEEEDIFF